MTASTRSLREQIERHVYHNPEDWSVEYLFDALGVFDASNRRFTLFLEGFVSSDIRPDEAGQRRLVEKLNVQMRVCGAELRETGTESGYPVFAAVAVGSPPAGRPKQLIFASSIKPDLRFRDAVSNDIEIVTNADKVLVYDRPIGAQGLRWCDLQSWWGDIANISDEHKAKVTLYRRLQSSLPTSSPPQRTLFDTFLGIVDGDHPQLRYSGGAIREDFIETLGRELAAVVLVPTRRIPEQQIDALPSPRGLLGERRRDIADFAIGRSERIVVGTRSVVSGGGRKRKYDKQAKYRDPEPQALEPDGGGGLRNEIVGWGHASRRALIRWTDHSANGREQSIAGQRLGDDLGHAERLRRRTGTREAGAELSGDRHHRCSRIRCANFIDQASARMFGHINTDDHKIHIII